MKSTLYNTGNLFQNLLCCKDNAAGTMGRIQLPIPDTAGMGESNFIPHLRANAQLIRAPDIPPRHPQWVKRRIYKLRQKFSEVLSPIR